MKNPTHTTKKMVQAGDHASQVEAQISQNKVMMFSKSWCPFCVRAKDLLNQKSIQFGLMELDQIADGDALGRALAAKVNKTSVPQIFINGEHIGGCDDLMAANQNGTLATKVA